MEETVLERRARLDALDAEREKNETPVAGQIYEVLLTEGVIDGEEPPHIQPLHDSVYGHSGMGFEVVISGRKFFITVEDYGV